MTEEENRQSISLTLTAETLSEMRKRAKLNGISVSSMVEMSLRRYLNIEAGENIVKEREV